VPKLAEKGRLLLVYCLDYRLPRLYLLFSVDTWYIGVPAQQSGFHVSMRQQVLEKLRNKLQT